MAQLLGYVREKPDWKGMATVSRDKKETEKERVSGRLPTYTRLLRPYKSHCTPPAAHYTTNRFPHRINVGGSHVCNSNRRNLYVRYTPHHPPQ